MRIASMDRPTASKARQQVLETERARAEHVQEVLKASTMIDGSFVTLGRKCGKPNCRCAAGEKHYSKYVSRSIEGRTKLSYVPSGDEVDVAAKTLQYRRFREARASLMKLAQQTAVLIDELQKALTESYPRAAPKGPAGARRKHGRKSSAPQE